jgi:hypothetical protein
MMPEMCIDEKDGMNPEIMAEQMDELGMEDVEYVRGGAEFG